MKRLQDIVGKRLNEWSVGPDYQRPHPHTSVGIEVEVEGARNPSAHELKRWHTVADGSLQGGIEFVSDPVWGTSITDALEELDAYFKKHEPYVSFRCSVHVHVNMLDMETTELIQFIKLYLMYEPALFRFHGDIIKAGELSLGRRYENIFCTPAAESVVIQKAYARLISHLNKDGLDRGYTSSKYCAMNANCLSTLGTLEFRHMAGTTDMHQISQWIDVLLQLKVAALLGEDPTNAAAVWGPYERVLDIRPEDLEEGQSIIENLNMWRL